MERKELDDITTLLRELQKVEEAGPIRILVQGNGFLQMLPFRDNKKDSEKDVCLRREMISLQKATFLSFSLQYDSEILGLKLITLLL